MTQQRRAELLGEGEANEQNLANPYETPRPCNASNRLMRRIVKVQKKEIIELERGRQHKCK